MSLSEIPSYTKDVRSSVLLTPEEEKNTFILLEEQEVILIKTLLSCNDKRILESIKTNINNVFQKVMKGKDEYFIQDMEESILALKQCEKGWKTNVAKSVVRSRKSYDILRTTLKNEEITDSNFSDWLVSVHVAIGKTNIIVEKLVKANLRLVLMFSNRYAKSVSTATLSDLIQDGNIGLLHAVEKFSHSIGVRFITYAAWWVRQAMRQTMINENHMVKIPINTIDVMNRVSKARSSHLTKTGEKLDDSVIMKSFGIEKTRLNDIIDSQNRKIISLDATVSDEVDASTFIDTFHSSNSIDPLIALQNKSLSKDISNMFSFLTQMESVVIKSRYAIDGFSPLTLREIASHYGVSRERIRQIEVKALKKLQKHRNNLIGHV